jgi:hypothetical protein
MTDTPMPEEKVREIALGIFKGTIFTSLQLPEDQPDLLPMVFMPLALMDKDTFAAFMAKKPCLIYGNMKDTFPRSINGYPMFSTFGHANREDTDRIVAKYNEIKSAVEGVD